MTARETVARTIRFQGAEPLPHDFPEKYGTDFAHVGMSPSPDERPKSGRDEWGVLWHNIGVSNLGEVKEPALKDWKDFDKLKIPDVNDPKRWQNLGKAREQAGDKFLIAWGISIYERVHFIRGIENAWMDIYDAPDKLGNLLDILVEMNRTAIKKYAAAGADGFMFCDDWGLQNRLMIAPESWRQIWKPRYRTIYKAAHEAGLLTLLHSCGHIVDILDDLIEVGLDVIQMDQQENMGLKLLGERFGGRITFFSPVDIQNTMVRGSLDDIRAYCRRMVELLGRPNGGFIPKWYGDPVGAGHRQEAVDAMCEEFLRLSREHKSPEKCDRNRIMIADDEPAIRDLFTTIISCTYPGIKVDQTCNGLDAVNGFRDAHQGILFLDMRMPEMDGYQAFLAIQDMCREKNWQMPSVVFCTGIDPPEAVGQIVGVEKSHCVLRRPVTSDDIINAVKSRLEVI